MTDITWGKRIVTVSRAQPTVGDEPVPFLDILVRDEIPRTRDIAGESHEVFMQQARVIPERDAAAIESAFHESLPGATYEALLRAMLARRACALVVPLGIETPTPEVESLRAKLIAEGEKFKRVHGELIRERAEFAQRRENVNELLDTQTRLLEQAARLAPFYNAVTAIVDDVMAQRDKQGRST